MSGYDDSDVYNEASKLLGRDLLFTPASERYEKRLSDALLWLLDNREMMFKIMQEIVQDDPVATQILRAMVPDEDQIRDEIAAAVRLLASDFPEADLTCGQRLEHFRTAESTPS